MTNDIFERYGDDPIALCRNWLSEAEQGEPHDPEAACLATCNAQGIPSARMVLIKEISQGGFKFHTNEESHKGQDLAENPHAELCFYWKSLRKQIRVRGRVQQVEDQEASDYFATRSIERKIGAWASKQSQAFDKREELESAVQQYQEKFSGEDHVPRPPYWKGYRLQPNAIEFWIAQKDRLHTRFVYTRQDDGAWHATWLCP